MAQAHSIPLPLELRSVLAGLASAEVADSQQWILKLMRAQGPVVVNMLWRMLGSEPDVLDAYQTAVCNLAAKGRPAIGDNPAGYFYRTAMNAGIAILRGRRQHRAHWPAIVDRHARRDAEQSEAGGLEQVFDQQDALRKMRDAICRLPPHLRDIIILRDLAGLPYMNVARIQGVTVGTARLYRRQAVLKLADLIGQEADE